MSSNVIQLVFPKATQAEEVSKHTYEVFACNNCGATDNFALMCDGSVFCSVCDIYQPLAVYEPDQRGV